MLIYLFIFIVVLIIAGTSIKDKFKFYDARPRWYWTDEPWGKRHLTARCPCDGLDMWEKSRKRDDARFPKKRVLKPKVHLLPRRSNAFAPPHPTEYQYYTPEIEIPPIGGPYVPTLHPPPPPPRQQPKPT